MFSNRQKKLPLHAIRPTPPHSPTPTQYWPGTANYAVQLKILSPRHVTRGENRFMRVCECVCVHFGQAREGKEDTTQNQLTVLRPPRRIHSTSKV